MVFRIRCLVRYMTWWGLLLFVLAVGGVSHWVGRDRAWVQLGRRYGLYFLFIGFSGCFAAGR